MFAFAPAPLPKPKRAERPLHDLVRLQGSWFGGEVEARFEDDRVTYYRGGKLVNVYRVTLPDVAATPKAMDFAGSDGRFYRCIYRFEGDSWVSCSGGSGTPRPVEFAKENKDLMLEVLRRSRD